MGLKVSLLYYVQGHLVLVGVVVLEEVAEQALMVQVWQLLHLQELHKKFNADANVYFKK